MYVYTGGNGFGLEKANRSATDDLSLWSYMNLCHTYVPPGHLHSGIPVDIRQEAQAETFRVWWVCESIHCQWGLRGVERLPNTLVELIVGYRAPKGRLWVSHWLQVYSRGQVSKVHLK